jgi:ATP-binding cassette subfamily B protein
MLGWPRLHTLRRIAAMLRPHATGEGLQGTIGILLGITVVALQALRPWPLKWILDYVTGAHTGRSVMHWVAADPRWGLALLSLGFVVLATLESFAEFGQIMVLNGTINRIVYRFRAALFAHVLRQPLSYHESRSTGELLTRVIYDTSRLRRGLTGFLVHIVQTAVLFGATLVVLFWHDRTLGIAFGVGGALAILAMRRRGRRIAKAAKKQRRKEGNLAAMVADELRSIRELQTFGLAGSAVLARFGRRNSRSLGQEQKVRRLAAGLTLRVGIILSITVAMAVGLGIEAILTGRLTAGDLVLFVSYASGMRHPFLSFANQVSRLGRTAACADRLARIATLEPGLPEGTVSLQAVEGRLDFKDVSVKTPKRSRGTRKWTLQDFSLRIPAGRRVAVLGSNGAGKSSLLRLVLRLADPESGKLRLDGHDLRDCTLDSLRRSMSVVFQSSVLAGLTVGENIGFGSPGATADQIAQAAAAAHADGFIAQLPDRYDTPVRRGGDLFSGGERQRLAIARAILRNGRLWLLDEPTSGLDPASANELTDLLLDLTRGRTTLWVTHDPALASRLDWVVVLDQGRLVFSGAPADWDAPPRDPGRPLPVAEDPPCKL